MNNRRLGADEHSIMGGKIGIMCVSLPDSGLGWTLDSPNYFVPC